jgi:hypothetical protein
MTLREFAQSIVNDPQYRDTLRSRAAAGTLPEDVELFLLEMADGRVSPLSAGCVPGSTQNPRTLALIRPSATVEEEEQA